MRQLRAYNLERIGHWEPLPLGLPPGGLFSAQQCGPVCQEQPTTAEERRTVRDRANGERAAAPRPNIVRHRPLSLEEREACMTAAERKKAARERHHAAAQAAAEILRRPKTPPAVREALAAWLASLSAEALSSAARLAEPSAKRSASKWARRQARQRRKEERAKQQTELVTID